MSDAIAKMMAAIQASQPDIQLTEQPAVPEPQTARQQVEPSAAVRSTPEVMQDATPICADLRAALAAQPDERRLATPAEREEVWNKRRRLQAILTEITSPMESRVAKLDARLATRRPWRDSLIAFRDEKEKALAAIENAGNKDFYLGEAIRNSLRIAVNGVDAGDEVFAGPLIAWLHEKGYRPEPGSRSYFVGRGGGLLSVEAEIEEIERERDEIIGRVEAALVQAKELLASLSKAEVTAV